MQRMKMRSLWQIIPENHKLKDKINKSLPQKAENLKEKNQKPKNVYMNVLLYIQISFN